MLSRCCTRCCAAAPAASWLALRDDEIGAASRGIDVVRYKSIAFCVSCALCGLAGSLYGTFSQLVSPELGLLQQTGLVLSMVVIGGMGSLTGAVVGALLVYLSSEWMRGFGNVQIIVFALLVIVFARYLPRGLWGLVAGRLQRGRREPAARRGPAVHFGGVAAVDDVSFDASRPARSSA